MKIIGKPFINGKFIETKQTMKIVSPLDNKQVGEVFCLDKTHINDAYLNAHNTYKKLLNIEKSTRQSWLIGIAEILLKNKKKLAKIMYFEIGKSIKDGLDEVERSVEYIYKTIETWNQIENKIIKIKNKTNTLKRVSLGVVLAISPFNYPINLAFSKIAPAILTGNTVIWKPATNGSLIAFKIMKLINDEVGLPNGLINLIIGKGSQIGDYLIENEYINMISFTGSVSIGKKIANSKKMVPLVLELGGNDAAYIRDDADIKKAVTGVIKGAFSFAGQRCTAIKRLIVHSKIKNEFLSLIKEKNKNLKIDPVITRQHAEYIQKILISEKENIIFGGNVVGNFIENTLVFTKKDSLIWKKELFAPVLPVIFIEDDDKAIELINETNFGLQNSIYTKDTNWAQKIALKIQSGSVNINGPSSRGPDEFPFLGIKDSGFGVQGIKESLISMTRYLNIVNNE